MYHLLTNQGVIHTTPPLDDQWFILRSREDHRLVVVVAGWGVTPRWGLKGALHQDLRTGRAKESDGGLEVVGAGGGCGGRGMVSQIVTARRRLRWGEPS
ncbi:hypothetical protein MTO96_028185 [Rhipicephalus appendiculatus]